MTCLLFRGFRTAAGKTTVARRMGQLFHSLGLLPMDEVVEKSASDLITGFVGQAGKQTHEVLKDAKGKVLFIDEARRRQETRLRRFVASRCQA